MIVGHFDTIHPTLRLGGDLNKVAYMLKPNAEADFNNNGARRLGHMVMHQGNLWAAHVDNIAPWNPSSPPVGGLVDALYVDKWNGFSWFNMGGSIDPTNVPNGVNGWNPGDRRGKTRVSLASDGTDIYLAYVLHVGGYSFSGGGGPYLAMNTVVLRRWNGATWELLQEFTPKTYNQGAPFGGAAIPLYTQQVLCLATPEVPGEPLVTWSELGSLYDGTGTVGPLTEGLWVGQQDGTTTLAVDGFRYNYEARYDGATPYIFAESSEDFDHQVIKMYDGYTGDVLQVADNDLISPPYTLSFPDAFDIGVSPPFWDGERYVYYLITSWHTNLPFGEAGINAESWMLQVPADGSGPFERLDNLSAPHSRTAAGGYFTAEFIDGVNPWCTVMPEKDNIWVSYTHILFETDNRFTSYPVRIGQYDRACLLDPEGADRPNPWDRVSVPGWRRASIDVDPNSPVYRSAGTTTIPPFADPGYTFCDQTAVADLENDQIFVMVLAGKFDPTAPQPIAGLSPNVWTYRVYKVQICRGCGECQADLRPHPVLNIQFRSSTPL